MEDACPKREKAECKISAGNHIDLLEACSLSELLHIHIEEDTLILTCRQLCQHKSWGWHKGLRELFPTSGLMFQDPAN